MPFITWDDSYTVCVAEIDAQHRRLVDLINDLHDAMKARRGQDVLTDILARMSDYVVTHFSTEEKYMVKFRFPGLSEHKKEHTAFVEKITFFKNEFEKGKVALSIEIFQFLKTWLLGHIMATDKKYSECFISNGLS